MKKPKEHTLELRPDEYESLVANPMIASMCDGMLRPARKRSGYMVLRLTEAQIEDLTGWVAAEANHAKTREEEEAIGEVCEHLEAQLFSMRRTRNR